MARDSYSPDQPSGRAESLQFDTNTGKWSSIQSSNTAEDATTADPAGDDSSKKIAELAKDTQTKSKKKADREFIEKEFTTLNGTLRLAPSCSVMSLKLGDVIQLMGLGKNLSGSYYISGITRVLNDDGFSMSISVIKTSFGGKIVTKEDSGRQDTVSKEV